MPTIDGTAGSNFLQGATEPDIINAFAGDDEIDGRGGVERLVALRDYIRV
jgi:hypothetical protein